MTTKDILRQALQLAKDCMDRAEAQAKADPTFANQKKYSESTRLHQDVALVAMTRSLTPDVAQNYLDHVNTKIKEIA